MLCLKMMEAIIFSSTLSKIRRPSCTPCYNMKLQTLYGIFAFFFNGGNFTIDKVLLETYVHVLTSFADLNLFLTGQLTRRTFLLL